MKRLNQTGSHVVALVLFALVIGVVAFAGYKVSQSGKPAQTVSNKTAVPETITTTKDLDDTSAALDNESSQVDTNLDSSSLDADLNSML